MAVMDLSHLERAEADARVQQLAAQDAAASFDLSQDVMLRASWIALDQRAGHEHGVMLFNMHHIASDGWSLGVLVSEFVEQYQALRDGKADPLPPLAIQYAIMPCGNGTIWTAKWQAANTRVYDSISSIIGCRKLARSAPGTRPYAGFPKAVNARVSGRTIDQ